MDKRLDILIFEKNLAKSREAAKELIKNNQISVHGRIISKPSALISESDDITVVGNVLKYVSRGGLKLEKAINEFDISLNNKICMDIGASTGGFTDCMLQNGAKKVYAVDVGHSQLVPELSNDFRVINMEKTNIRTLEKDKISDIIEFISIDVSFISLKLVLPKASELISDEGKIVALIKPQFECGKAALNKNGVLKNKNQHITVLKDIIAYIKNFLTVKGMCFSPIRGGDGNVEYLIYLTKSGINKQIDEKIIVEEAFIELKGGLWYESFAFSKLKQK